MFRCKRWRREAQALYISRVTTAGSAERDQLVLKLAGWSEAADRRVAYLP